MELWTGLAATMAQLVGADVGGPPPPPPPVSASLGAMALLAEKLDALLDTELKLEVEKLKNWLVLLSRAQDPPVTALIWMKDVRELSYDMENCVDVAEPGWMHRMSEFKVRVKEANERYESYKLGTICTDIASDSQLPMVEGGRRPDDLPVVGLYDGPFHSLHRLLTDDGGKKELKVLSIVGVGGIGKTTLAKQLWRDKELGNYFDCRAFVRTAKKADMRRILRSILAQVRPRQPPDSNEVHDLIRDLREHLWNKRYFLIIDDLWSTSVWDVARRAFPQGNGSRIITTTEVQTVAFACCSDPDNHMFKIEPLSPSQSKELFTIGMFGSGGEKSRQLDEVITAQIIRRCGGLPLAVISMSSVIASLGEAYTEENWEKMQKQMPTNTTPADMLKQVLNFCFNCLPSSLQTCLLYLSLYPENYIILKEDIMKQWVAEGFILAPIEHDKMKVAGNYFDKLVGMGMIQHIDVNYSDDVLYYAVHRTVHDLITSKSIEENFVTVMDYSQRTVRLCNKVSRLSLQFGSATYATTPASIGLSQVRSLAFIGIKSCLPSILEFKLLRFLSIHMWADHPSTSVDLKSTSKLVLLRYLHVTCNDTVHLPDLKGLIHLETLDINARVVDIPANIVHLRSWLHLRLGVGTELPDVTGILQNVTLNAPISLDDSSSPPDSVKTIDLLSPISRIPKWVGQLRNLCILKFVVKELQREDIINLQGLPFLAVLSLRVQRRTREVIVFTTGAFAALEYFEFRCGVLCLAFEEGSMPNLQRVKLGFNAHRGEQYDIFLVSKKDMSGIQTISVLIGSAAGAEESDLKAAESVIREAIGSHYSQLSIKRSDMIEEEFDPPEICHSFQDQHSLTPSGHLGSRKESQDVRLIQGEHPSASSAQLQRRKQVSQEEFDLPAEEQGASSTFEIASQSKTHIAIEEKHPSASSDQPPRRKKESKTEVKQDSGTYSQSFNRMTPPSARSKNNNYFSPQQSGAKPRKIHQTSKAELSTAYLALGLAKAVVEGSLSKARAAIEVQAKLPQSARRDMMFIADEFDMMRSFLNLLEESIENELVRTWVKKIHELAYSVEDCMELVAHLDKEKKSLRFRRLYVPCAPARMPALDQAVSEIVQLKARVAEVSTWNVRYNLISDTTSMPVVQQQQVTDASNMLAQAREVASRAQILGGGDLTQLITNKVSDDLQVISVWGSGGDHGTASIIMKTYSDPEICRNFTSRAWLKLVHPSSPHDLIPRFMLQFCPVGEQEGADMGMEVPTMMQATQEDLFKDFQKIVTEKRYLVVLEGMSNMEEWHALRKLLPDRRKGSCIIVSTQQDEIARLCFEHSYQILELKQFSPEHSICALFKKDSDTDGDTGKIGAMEVSFDVGRVLEIKDGNTLSPQREAAAYWMENCLLVGRKSEMNELRNYTARARFKNSQVISVWGIAGIGKSALVRNFYCERVRNRKQFNAYRWVDLSHPFNLHDFSRSLLSYQYSEKDPIKECRKLLSQNQCLLIIDNLRSKEEWDSIQDALVSRHSASVIIVITTEANIATYCTNNEEQVLNVRGLEADAGMDLFRKEVHRNEPSLSPLHVRGDLELQELISNCGGLPKVIVALAELLTTKTVEFMDNVRSLNRRFMHNLETNPEYNSLHGLLSWMDDFFRDCPVSLKPCIFYLTIFPRRHPIRRRRLIRRWIAEGYSRDSDEKAAEEQGEEFFSKLFGLSIIQKIHRLGTTAFSETRMVGCQVNGFIREYIVSRRMEENHVFELGPNCVLTTQRTGYHLIILTDWDRDRIVFDNIDFSRLRSLTVFGKWESFFISKSMEHLRVLDLEDTVGVKDDHLKMVVHKLRRLKFLSLRGCTEIVHLPSSLGDLRQLQTLDVRYTSIVKLPGSITKLQKLQYIRAGTTIQPSPMSASSNKWPIFCRRRSLFGVCMPRGIRKLTALHTVGVVNVRVSGGKDFLEELKKLTQLRKVGVSGINKHNSKDFMHATSGHVHLESLLVKLDEESKCCLDEISLPGENLRSLKLYDLQDKLPLLRSYANQLRKLDLEMVTLGKSDIQLLANNLPALRILRLRLKQFQDGKLHFYAELSGLELRTFEKVKILEIACSSTAQDYSHLCVAFGSKSMMNLELLKIDCSTASYKLNGLTYLSELKKVLLKGADNGIMRALENQLSVDLPTAPPTVELEELPRWS